MTTEAGSRKIHKIVLAIVPSVSVPKQDGEFSEPVVAGGVALALHGWTVLSHAVTQQLSGDLLLSLFCEREQLEGSEENPDGTTTVIIDL